MDGKWRRGSRAVEEYWPSKNAYSLRIRAESRDVYMGWVFAGQEKEGGSRAGEDIVDIQSGPD